MTDSGKWTTYLSTVAFALAGAIGGKVSANYYIRYLGNGAGPKLEPNQVVLSNVVLVVVGLMLGLVLLRYMLLMGRLFKKKPWQDKVVIGLGIFLGIVLTALLNSILGLYKAPPYSVVLLGVVMCYVSIAALGSIKEQIGLVRPSRSGVSEKSKPEGVKPKILDTNVIIDGRIADICKAGFLEGVLYVPKFVLEELQLIADSADSLKRARGRRGLEILHEMRKEWDINFTDSLTTDDARADVDSRLVLAAKELNAAIVTNDYNLNKVAGLQGVDVLNMNELANALKPVVLPGEEMTVTVIKEGKEKEQGIGYLDDGTMIVVEGARRLIGETLEVAVTSVLQTVQGKMIFGKMKDGTTEHTSENVDKNGIRAFAGSRARTKVR